MRYVENPGWHDEIDQPVKAWFHNILLDIGTDTEALAPVDTGALKQSIKVEESGDTGYIGSDLDYSVYVEEGHRVAYRGRDGQVHYTGGVVPPQPYLKPALYRAR
jgi:hypothetical protein